MKTEWGNSWWYRMTRIISFISPHCFSYASLELLRVTTGGMVQWNTKNEFTSISKNEKYILSIEWNLTLLYVKSLRYWALSRKIMKIACRHWLQKEWIQRILLALVQWISIQLSFMKGDELLWLILFYYSLSLVHHH